MESFAHRIVDMVEKKTNDKNENLKLMSNLKADEILTTNSNNEGLTLLNEIPYREQVTR